MFAALILCIAGGGDVFAAVPPDAGIASGAATSATSPLPVGIVEEAGEEPYVAPATVTNVHFVDTWTRATAIGSLREVLSLRTLAHGLLAALKPARAQAAPSGDQPLSVSGDLAILFSQPAASGELPLLATITIGKLSPGSEVALLGISRVRTKDAYTNVTTYREVLLDDDQDGAVELEIEGPIPLHSVWAAIDLATGAWGFRSAGVLLLPVDTSKARFDPATGAVSLPGRNFEMLWVRPGVGAWIGRAADGSLSDSDAVEDGVFRGRTEELLPSPGKSEAAPAAPRDGDVVITIDRHELRTAVYVVGGKGRP